MRYAVCAIFVLIFISLRSGWCDTIFLKDGRKITGRVIDRSEGRVTVNVSGTELVLPESQIETIESGRDELPLPEPRMKPAKKSASGRPAQKQPAPAEENQDKDLDKNPDKLLRRVIEVSGIEAMVKGLPALLHSQLLQQKDLLDPAVYAQAEKIFAAVYGTDESYESVLAALTKKIDQPRFLAAWQHLHNPLFQKMLHAWRRAESSAGKREEPDFFMSLNLNPPTQERVDLLQKLDAFSGWSERQVRMEAAALRQCYAFINLCLPQEKRLPPEAIETLVAQACQKLLVAKRNATLLRFLFVYRDIDDAEITELIKLSQLNESRWLDALDKECMHTACDVGLRKAQAACGHRKHYRGVA